MKSPPPLEDRSARTAFVAAAAAFATYFCAYGLRKPYTAAEFAGPSFFGSDLQLKTALVISQVIGYGLAKYAGIKFVSELQRRRLLPMLIAAAATAELALVGFAVTPGSWKAAWMFLNGVPLGFVWGLVVRYLEGRTTSDLLMAALCCSFVLAGGVVKDAGRLLMTAGVSEFWMPAATGACFLLPFIVAVVILDRVPAPTARDVALRTERRPMTAPERRAFLRDFAVGLVPLFAFYAVLTAMRDYRDYYSAEILRELKYGKTPGIFTMVEGPTALTVTAVVGALVLVRNHQRSLLAIFSCMALGMIVVGGGTLLHASGQISGLAWMIATGVGGYLAYVPFNAVVFERIVAATRSPGTAVFAIYVADALGYTGSVALQLHKDLAAGEARRTVYFASFTIVTAVIGLAALAISGWFFLVRLPNRDGFRYADSE
ncbi:MAG: hypothetical protein KDA44_06025 [Planctomycetales bacterium]|nr:hypothetical protein [Planctomycetales bacterium]